MIQVRLVKLDRRMVGTSLQGLRPMAIVRIFIDSRHSIITIVGLVYDRVSCHMRRAATDRTHVHNRPAQLPAGYSRIAAQILILLRQLYRRDRLFIVLERVHDIRVDAIATSILILARIIIHLLRRCLRHALERLLAFLQLNGCHARHIIISVAE